MRRALRQARLIALCALILSVAGRSLRAEIAGPAALPAQLPGLWRVSLCASRNHTWIRLENMQTGELHTLGRYFPGMGAEYDQRTGQQIWPGAPACGVTWDIDRKYHNGVRTDGRVLRMCYVRNVPVYRGHANGYGHCIVRMNCVTYARDAWHYYSGEWYWLPPVTMPSALERSVCGVSRDELTGTP
jgi:hypothetical protein